MGLAHCQLYAACFSKVEAVIVREATPGRIGGRLSCLSTVYNEMPICERSMSETR